MNVHHRQALVLERVKARFDARANAIVRVRIRREDGSTVELGPCKRWQAEELQAETLPECEETGCVVEIYQD